MFSKKSLEKFKAIYKKQFNEDISNQEALERATRLLNVYRAVYGDPFDYGIDRKPEDKDKNE